MSFKKGDVVRCVDAGDNFSLACGGLYVVAAVHTDVCGKELIRVVQNGAGYWASRFVLADNAAMAPTAKATPHATAISASHATKCSCGCWVTYRAPRGSPLHDSKCDWRA